MAIFDSYVDNVLRERVDTTASTLTSYNAGGAQTGQRALTAPEVATYAARVAQQAASANKATIEQQANTALDTNRTFLAIASPSNAQTLAEVQALARQSNGVIRLLLNKLDGTN